MSGFLDFVHERLAPLGEITSRKMFGGHCVYCDGMAFALIANDVLYLKADKENRAEFEAAGLEAFKPFDDQDTVMSYYLAPPDFYDNDEALHKWGGAAVAAARRARARKKPKKR